MAYFVKTKLYDWLKSNNGQCQYEEKPFQFVEKMKHDVNLYMKFRNPKDDLAGNIHLKNVTMLAGKSYKLHLMLLLAASNMDEDAMIREALIKASKSRANRQR